MIAIEKLSRIEKLQMMEALWRDLSAHANDVASPAWHGEALQQAEAAQATGTAHMVDWAQAKEMLRKRTAS